MQQSDQPVPVPVVHSNDVDEVTLGRHQDGAREGGAEYYEY